jgi:hypothetical protein
MMDNENGHFGVRFCLKFLKLEITFGECMTENVKALNKLKKGLVQLQQEGAVVLADQRRVRRKLYEHILELYLWWRSARQVEGFLEAEYATLGRRMKRIKEGINFNPLFWLAWGNSTDKTNQDSDRYSRALNAIHEEFESKPEYYAKDSIAKLINFITAAGGMSNLRPYGKYEEEPDEAENKGSDTAVPTASKKAIENERLKLTALLSEYGQKKLIPFDGFLNADFKRYGLLLVERTDDGLNILDSYQNPKLLDSILADHIKGRFEVTVFALRPLVELIQTQCLPKHLEGLVEKLVDKSALPEHGRKKFTSHRRLIYRPGSNEFVLSPMNALAGVVSVVEPFFPLILEGCEKDVYLAPVDTGCVGSKVAAGL